MMTNREIDVLRLYAEGESAKTIARKLKLSKFTVMTYSANLKQKLDAKTMTQAVAMAIRNGWIK